MEEKTLYGRIVGRYLEITEIENYLQSINKPATLSTNPYIPPNEDEINKWSLAFFDFMTSEEEMESLINSLRGMGLSVKGNISNLPLKTVEEIYAYCKPITVITKAGCKSGFLVFNFFCSNKLLILRYGMK